jgi:hypothetical protein
VQNIENKALHYPHGAIRLEKSKILTFQTQSAPESHKQTVLVSYFGSLYVPSISYVTERGLYTVFQLASMLWNILPKVFASTSMRSYI